MTIAATPIRFAAPAPTQTQEAQEDDTPALPGADELHALFEQWSWWCRTRRYFAPAPGSGHILGKLSSKTRAFCIPGGPDAVCSMQMSALHLAILGQPREALDSKVFWLYYGHRAAVIKQAAGELGISRQHFYRLLGAFCRRVEAAAKQIQEDNLAARDRIAHAPAAASLAVE